MALEEDEKDGEGIDEFKPIFKYYKSKAPPPNLNKVLSINNRANFEDKDEHFKFGLKKPEQWSPPTFLDSGLIIQPDPFTHQGKLEWALTCLRDYTKNPPYRTNLLKDASNPWLQRLENPSIYGTKIRWSTLGFHHNWDSKEYDLSQSDAIVPPELNELSSFLVKTILKVPEYLPQAAIVNFYPLNATLSPHTDHSEPNVEAPLLSLSFGQSAIFLIGGKTKAQKPQALFLRHGDILIMTRESRLSYHAVPKILQDTKIPSGWDCESNFAAEYLQSHRINVNVRQVL